MRLTDAERAIGCAAVAIGLFAAGAITGIYGFMLWMAG